MIERIQPIETPDWAQHINWATQERDLQGDWISQAPGITRLAIGQDVYMLKQIPEGEARFEHGEVNFESDWSAVYVGKLDQPPIFKAEALLDHPFSFNDPQRLNDSAALLIGLSKTYIAWSTAQEIDKSSDKFIKQLKQIAPDSDVDLMQSIAILNDRLETYLSTHYPNEFLKKAAEMERLGIHTVQDLGHGGFSDRSILPYWTASHIRVLFSPSKNSAVA